MSSRTISELGAPRIHSVVMARGAAQKIKELSSGVVAEQQKRLDKGGFAVTFTDDPTGLLVNSPRPKLGRREGRRRSNTASSNELIQPIQLDSHTTNRLDPGDRQRRRRSTTVSSGCSEHISDSESENLSQSRLDDRQRRRRYTTVAKPPKSASSGLGSLVDQEPLNTYRVEPDNKFQHWKVKEIIKKTLEERLIENSYNQELCHRMSGITADAIKERVKSLQFSRYKIISVVSIGQKTGQSVRVASSFVWDSRFDCYAQHCLERGDMYAIGVVYGIYCE